ncbi:trypsin-like peptidase domain-containing protein [Streptomyces sp. ASQP_92]|uniref:trypsin-like peptidase domain-containing protein n=1 Tax=Streptomyces sp. ASQP_92 TaxID=2979116 RepID=UPI0021BED23E|nr:trypsin-like peptidase domain-containing protein [Streptomyces sp. ASQP_92]MCT9092961.1 trypsin-like peptidase domain-containing protein [Streptomyces sp. ASQP_92]
MRASAEQGLRPERVAEIIVSLPYGGGRRGTGYLVSPGLILTAAHVVDGGAEIRARFQADQPEEWSTEAAVSWRHQGIDIAVLAVEAGEPVATGAAVPPVPFGRVDQLDAVLTCTTLGFPRFKLRTDGAGSRFRDVEHVRATCAALSNRREGTLDLTIASPPPDDPDPERSPWEGMSGAPVFSNGRLVGVVARHHRGDGPGRLAASRVDHWADGLDAAEQAVLEELLGRELRYSALPAAAPVDAADLVQEIYRAQLADIAPQQLEDRRTELDALVSFCAGPHRYLWLQAPPWAGKTALAAWFARHPPAGVVPVWFFITARYASQSDSKAYTEAVIDQLATIAGREPLRNASAMARDGERRLLLREAAERVAERGGTLVLVVDGLDEDQSLKTSGTSIASLLPERPPPNVRILVTSRTSPGIPGDVGGAHPLRHCRVEKLSAAPAAQHTEYEAKYDLQQALSGDRLQRDLVGLLTAARGALTIDDLRELTKEPAYELRRRLGSAFGRILRLRGGVGGGGGSSADIDGYGYGGHGDEVTLYASSRGYLFAHETLLTAAQDELGPDADMYRERLDIWAESYQHRGWPENTPMYLLQPYGRLLIHLQDIRRATALATDMRRSDRLHAVTGSDAACLAEIVAARDNVRRGEPGDLGTLAALAVAEDLVARRNASLHPTVPEVYARLGRTRQAIGLARSVLRPMDRAWALSLVANVLAEASDPRAVGLAEEAVGLAQAEEPWGAGPYLLKALGQMATVLALVGKETESLHRLHALPAPDSDWAVTTTIRAYVETAVVLRDSSSASGLLRMAEVHAGSITALPDRARALAAVADGWQRAGEPAHAARLYDRVVKLARSRTGDQVDVSGAVADVLRHVRPCEAANAARPALIHADELLCAPQKLTDWREEYGAAHALVATGRVDDARMLAVALEEIAHPAEPERWVDVWPLIAEGYAREGRADEAWAALGAFREVVLPFGVEDHSVARVVGLLAEAGAADRLEPLLPVSAETRPWTVAEAYAALALHFADSDQDRSLRLVSKAERVRTTGDGASHRAVRDRDPHRAVHTRIAAFAAALARAGRIEEAQQLLDVIDTSDICAWGYAAVSVALSDKDPDRVLRYAQRAVEVMRSSDSPPFARANISTTIIQALARAGAARHATQAISQLAGEAATFIGQGYVDLARALAAEGFWSYDPEAAQSLVDAFLTTGKGSVQAAHLLAVTKPYDETRSRALTERLCEEVAKNRQYGTAVLRCLLSATLDPAAARRDLDRLALEPAGVAYAPSATALALACAALGDPAAALAIALGRTREEERAEVLGHLAAHAAGISAETLVPSPLRDPLTYQRPVLRLAAFLFPPPGGSDLPRARELLADALTRDGWHHAIPVLAAIDPEAVLRARDVLFTHLRLGG